MSVEVAKSTDGGDTFTGVTSPVTGVFRPDDSTEPCSFTTALNGGIFYGAPSQIEVSPNGNLHVVYSYDPDGQNVGDVVDVFYRRSTDQGETWEPEIRLSDDATLTDQFFPTISISPEGRVVAAWYDRRGDEDRNFLVDYEDNQSVVGRCASGGATSISGTYRQVKALAAFDGESFDGSWTPNVKDVVANGTTDSALNEWCLLPAAQGSPVDSDGDGVLDGDDNCTLVANADQRDTNGDGFGNACDADINNDCVVNVVDLGDLRTVFFTDDGDADFNGDGIVNVSDLGILRLNFFEAPGPSGVGNSCQ